MPQREAIIVLRQSPDWQQLDHSYLDTLEPFEKQAGLPIGHIRRIVTLWDASFHVPYFQVRQRLKELTLQNLASVQKATFVPIEHIDAKVPSARFYFFSDDDDWLAPDIVERLCANDLPTADGFLWLSARLADGLEIRQRRYCFTNNYCVTDAYIRSGQATQRLQAVLQHFDANRIVLSSKFRALEIREPLSVANKHPCSPARLFHEYGPAITNQDLSSDVNKFVEGLTELTTPAGLEWVRPYVDQVRQLFQAVL